MPLKSYKLIFGLSIIAMAIILITITNQNWLQANLFSQPLSDIPTLEQLSKVQDIFRIRMDDFLAKYRPGDFNPLTCKASGKNIVELIDATNIAWGLDETTMGTITTFENLETAKEKWNFIENQIIKNPNFQPISFNLYESILNNYFIEHISELSLDKELEEKETTAISAVLSKSEQLKEEVRMELDRAESALKAAFVLLTEEHRAAVIIGGIPGNDRGGLCKILDESDNFRQSLKVVRKELEPLVENSGMCRTK